MSSSYSHWAVATGAWGQCSTVASTSSRDRGAPPCLCKAEVHVWCQTCTCVSILRHHLIFALAFLLCVAVRPWQFLGSQRLALVFGCNRIDIYVYIYIHVDDPTMCLSLRPWMCSVPWSRTCCSFWNFANVYMPCWVFQDAVESFALCGSFMAEFRDDKQHAFFNGLDVADPASVQTKSLAFCNISSKLAMLWLFDLRLSWLRSNTLLWRWRFYGPM